MDWLFVYVLPISIVSASHPTFCLQGYAPRVLLPAQLCKPSRCLKKNGRGSEALTPNKSFVRTSACAQEKDGQSREEMTL